mgnify:CR=1 FL=1
MSEQVLFRAKGICKSFPGVKALQNVNFDLKAGEVHALLGENGAGKSTFIKILGGNYRPDEGTIEIDGETVTQMSIHESRARGISIVHQELCLAWNMRVYENIMLGREITKGGICRERDMIEYASTALKNLNLNIDPMAMTSELSTGKRQMIEIAKAVSYGAKIIVMDEPTSSLSDNEVDALFETIYTLKARGVGIIYISHRLEELATIADRVTVLRDGQWIATVNYHDVTREQIINMMVGREIKNMFPKSNTPTTEEFFRVEHLTGGRFTDISFSLNRGEILGVAGLMGAGRTEIMRAIFGLDPLTAGTITMNGKVLRIRSSRDALDQGIGYVSEDRRSVGLVLGMTVRDNITMSNLSQYCRHSWIRHKEEKRVADEQIREFSIKTPSAEQIAANLSGGNQQKIVLSKTLLCQPEVIILDEPTRGIDVGAKAEIHKMISALASQGKGIIMISSEMPEILGMSDRIIVIHEGRKKGELLRENASQQAIMEMMLAQ